MITFRVADKASKEGGVTFGVSIESDILDGFDDVKVKKLATDSETINIQTLLRKLTKGSEAVEWTHDNVKASLENMGYEGVIVGEYVAPDSAAKTNSAAVKFLIEKYGTLEKAYEALA